MTDLIVILIIAAIVGGAAFYIYRSKKNGKKCIGCPYAGGCPKSSCACAHTEKGVDTEGGGE